MTSRQRSLRSVWRLPRALAGCILGAPIILILWTLLLPVLLLFLLVQRVYGLLPARAQEEFSRLTAAIGRATESAHLPLNAGKAPRDAAELDAWWEANGATAEPRLVDLDWLHWARQEGWRRVLIVGPGVSIEPAGLAALGFEVTTIELSPAAHRLALERHADPKWVEKEMEMFRFWLDEAALPEEIERLRVPRNAATPPVRIVGDFRNQEGSWDVVILRRVLADHVESEEATARVAEKVATLVRRGGLVVATFGDDPGAREVWRRAFTAQRFHNVHRPWEYGIRLHPARRGTVICLREAD